MDETVEKILNNNHSFNPVYLWFYDNFMCINFHNMNTDKIHNSAIDVVIENLMIKFKNLFESSLRFLLWENFSTPAVMRRITSPISSRGRRWLTSTSI